MMKMFAKHFKLPEQASYLRHNIVRAGVGTPHRMSQLAEVGALSLSAARYIILDVAKDSKEQTIFDYEDICKELVQFIFVHCWSYIESGQLRLIWY